MDAEHSYRYWGDETPQEDVETKQEEIIIEAGPLNVEIRDVIPPKPRIGLGLASMILGIITFVFFWIPTMPLSTGILAVIFGIIALAKKCRKSFALTGLITGGVSIALSIILLVGLFHVDWGNGFEFGSPDDGFSFRYEYGTDNILPDMTPGNNYGLDIEDFV